ncbi:MAG TPA: hypothetical protein VFC50_03875 [Candidatus Dormibacteraeota bacterium]|nr:hypothetical protein [Candidatus Dormibacteraeota bacterium]
MKLIFIYGPTAAGKHTVGQKLADLTGYKFFYNHLTVDVVRPLFGNVDEDQRRNDLLDGLRLMVIETAVRYGMDIIFTLAYTAGQSDEFVANVIKVVTEGGGQLHFVRLTPPDATIFERIGNESRRKLNKPTDPEHLRRKMAKYDIRALIDYPSSLDLDTSRLSPEESTDRIIKEFGLLD